MVGDRLWRKSTNNQFNVWVSDRIFEIKEGHHDLTENPNYHLCTFFKGAAVPGRSMRLDCDRPVTGKYVIIQEVHLDNHPPRSSLQLCDWKVFGLVCMYRIFNFVCDCEIP